MSMFLLNKTFIEKLDKHRRSFFWAGKKKKRKYHMVKWSRICRSKIKGGLGVKDLRKQNISLLCSIVTRSYGMEVKKCSVHMMGRQFIRAHSVRLYP
jgi:hypothetical protein